MGGTPDAPGEAVTGYARMVGASNAPGETGTVREKVRESGRIPGLASFHALACTGAHGRAGLAARQVRGSGCGTGRLVYYA